MREVDDIYNFKTIFKKKILGETYNAQTIDQILKIFSEIVSNKSIEKYDCNSELNIPYETSQEDTYKILSFLLNTPIKSLSTDIIKDIMNYVANIKGKFKQTDGILVIHKI